MALFHTILEKTRQFLSSIWFMLLVFTGAAWIVAAQAPIEGTTIFVLLICALLLICDNTAVTLLPFSLLCIFVLKEYNSFDRFIKLWWLAFPVVPSVLFHLIAYREKPKKSILLYGLVAITVAITLGGLGFITKEEYFTGANLYYVAGLGVGMLLMHLLISGKYHNRPNFDIRHYLCLVFYLIGAFAVYMLFQHFYVNWEVILEAKKLPQIQWSNNLSTFLMIALPFGFYFSSKNPLHMITTLLMLAAMMLTGSRAPLIFGTLEYVVCVIVFCIVDYKHWYVYALPLVVIILFLLEHLEPIIGYVTRILEVDLGNLQLEDLQGESRYQMALRAWDEIRANPLFGSGLGSTSRQDIYNPVKFAMNWYHSAPFQIIGSLGIVGIASYLFLWTTRGYVFFRNRSLFSHTAMLSQFGLFAMSLVNPGFFCPFPYEFYMVMLFAVMAQQKKQKTLDK